MPENTLLESSRQKTREANAMRAAQFEAIKKSLPGAVVGGVIVFLFEKLANKKGWETPILNGFGVGLAVFAFGTLLNNKN